MTPHQRYRKTDKGKQHANAQAKRRRERGTALINEAKDVPCADCGNRYPPYVMDFDHKGNKDYNVGNMKGMSPETILLEIAKCDVVCANCHRIRTHGGN